MWWNPPASYWEVFWAPPPHEEHTSNDAAPAADRSVPRHHHPASQLNGANGEVTGTDDHDNGKPSGHQQRPRRANLNNRGAKHRGGKAFGPPVGVVYRHPDNRSNTSEQVSDWETILSSVHAESSDGSGASVPSSAPSQPSLRSNANDPVWNPEAIVRCPEPEPPIPVPPVDPDDLSEITRSTKASRSSSRRSRKSRSSSGRPPTPPPAPRPPPAPNQPPPTSPPPAAQQPAAKPPKKDKPQQEVRFHENGIGAAIVGSLAERVATDAPLRTGQLAAAGAAAGEYAGRKLERELRVSVANIATLDRIHLAETNREVIRRDRYAQQALAQRLRAEQADNLAQVAKHRAKALAEAAYARAIAQKLQDDHAASEVRLREMAARQLEERAALHRQTRLLTREDEQERCANLLQSAIDAARAELDLVMDDEYRDLCDEKVRQEARRYRAQLPDLIEIAHAKHAIAEAEEGGKVKDRKLIKPMTIFSRNPRRDLEPDPKTRSLIPDVNLALVDHPNFRHVDVNLVPALLFVKHKRPSWWQWMLNGLAYGWKRTIQVTRPDGTLGHADVDPVNSRVLFDDNGAFHGTLSLLQSDDRRICRDILNDYRILGIGSSDLQALLTSGEGFIKENNFTHIQPVLVHPVLYQCVLVSATGVVVTKNQAASSVREFKDPWMEYIQQSVFHNTVNLALQHAQMYNFQRNRTLVKIDDILGDL